MAENYSNGIQVFYKLYKLHNKTGITFQACFSSFITPWFTKGDPTLTKTKINIIFIHQNLVRVAKNEAV